MGKIDGTNKPLAQYCEFIKHGKAQKQKKCKGLFAAGFAFHSWVNK